VKETFEDDEYDPPEKLNLNIKRVRMDDEKAKPKPLAHEAYLVSPTVNALPSKQIGSDNSYQKMFGVPS
jgi:hypothetical protein